MHLKFNNRKLNEVIFKTCSLLEIHIINRTITKVLKVIQSTYERFYLKIKVTFF